MLLHLHHTSSENPFAQYTRGFLKGANHFALNSQSFVGRLASLIVTRTIRDSEVKRKLLSISLMTSTESICSGQFSCDHRTGESGGAGESFGCERALHALGTPRTPRSKPDASSRRLSHSLPDLCMWLYEWQQKGS